MTRPGQKVVGLGRVRIGLISAIEAMQLNAKECHTKEGSMTVDIKLVEVDRGESRLLDESCCRSRSSKRDGGGHGCQIPKACPMDSTVTA